MSTGRSAGVRCSFCGRPAVVRLPYARLALCEEHFLEYVEERVGRTLRRYGLVPPGGRVVVGVSGGKDSTALAYILSRLLGPDHVLLVHVNLGIRGYSERLEEAVRRLAEATGSPLLVLHVEEITGMHSIWEFARAVRRPVCSVCGLVKRYVLNAVAVEAGAAAATGHTLDDAVAYLLKNFVTQSLDQLAKWLPRNPEAPGAAARIRPLVEVSERETLLYIILRKLPFVHAQCPLRPREPMEDTFKELMNRLEERHPGIKLSFLRSYIRNVAKGKLKAEAGEAPATRCKYCGLIAQGEVCSFCKLTMRATGKPMGPHVRELVRRRLREIGWPTSRDEP